MVAQELSSRRNASSPPPRISHPMSEEAHPCQGPADYAARSIRTAVTAVVVFAVFEVEWDDAGSRGRLAQFSRGTGSRNGHGSLRHCRGPFSELSRARCPQLLTSPTVCSCSRPRRLTVLMIEQRRVGQSHLRSTSEKFGCTDRTADPLNCRCKDVQGRWR